MIRSSYLFCLLNAYDHFFILAPLDGTVARMEKVKVFAIFDDGNSLVNRTHFLMPIGGTIGDAQDCFFKINAETNMWKADGGIKLVGILSEKDLLLPYGKATPSLAPTYLKIQDMMEPSDFLVFRSAEDDLRNDAPHAQLKSEPVVAADAVNTEETKPRTGTRESSCTDAVPERNEAIVAAAPATRAGTDTTQGDSPEQVTRKRVKSKTSRRHVGTAAALLRRIQDYNNPPRLKDDQRPTRTCQKRSRNDSDSKDTSQMPPKKKSKVQNKTKMEKKTRGTLSYSSHRVGSRFFYKNDDGIEHAVRVLSPTRNKEFELKLNERVVRLEGNGGKKVKIATSKLLADTPERRNQLMQRKELEKERQKYELARFGPATSIEGPFPLCDKASALVVQDSRRVYFARNNETPLVIAKKFGVPAGKIVQDNRQLYPTLQGTSRFLPKTAVVLPKEEITVGSTNETNETSTTSQKEKVHSVHMRTKTDAVSTQNESCEPVYKSDEESVSVTLL